MKHFLQNTQWRTRLIWLALFLLPLVVGDYGQAQLGQFMIYGLFAMSLGFLWGQVGVLSFGQAIFFGLGAYSMALVSLEKVPGLGSSTLAGLLLALASSAVVAAVLGGMLFYGKGLAGAFFGIVTLCAAVIVESGARQWDYIGGYNGLFGIPQFDLPDIVQRFFPDSLATYYIALFVSLAIYAALCWLSRTPFGTVLAAVRDNDKRVAFLGYNVPLHRTVAFVLSAMVASLAGAIFVKLFGFVSPTLTGFALSTEVLIWVAVGGRQVLMGAFLGALLVRSVESMLSARFGSYWLLLLGFTFVVVVVFFPVGVFGRVLHLGLPKRFSKSKSDDRINSMKLTSCRVEEPT